MAGRTKTGLNRILTTEPQPNIPTDFGLSQKKFARELLDYLRSCFQKITGETITQTIIEQNVPDSNYNWLQAYDADKGELCWKLAGEWWFEIWDMTNGDTKWLNKSRTFPAGTYEIQYLGGTMRYRSGTEYGIHFTVGGFGVYVDHDNGATHTQAPGDDVKYTSREDCEAVNLGAVKTFTHTGGKIGFSLWDSPYTDDVIVGGYPPAFKIRRVS